MVETKIIDPTFIGLYQASNGAYVGASNPIRVGGGGGWNTFIGFPSSIRNLIKESKTPVKMRFSLNVTDSAEFDVGRHKQTSNKASSGLPYYEYLGIHPTLALGRQTINLDSFIDDFTSGWQGIVLYAPVGADAGSAYGTTRTDLRAWIELDGTWNNPPAAPTIIYPNGGETLSGIVELRADPATDPEEPQTQLRYQWGIYDGKQWSYLPLTEPGIINITADFSKYPETSTARVALRAFDSHIDYSHGNWGAWDYSDGVFSIRRNVAPNAPAGLHPSRGEPIDRTGVTPFSWQHSDTDQQSRFDLFWRLRGSTAWNTITRNTPNQYYYMAGDTLPAGVIEWQIRTYDQMQLASPFSDIQIFSAVDATDAPTITRPAHGEEVTEARPVVQWSSIDQEEYQIEVTSGTAVIWSENKISTNKAVTVGADLTNNTAYNIRVRVRSSTGLWSNWDEVSITTHFTPPPAPGLSLDTDNERGSIMVIIENPDPIGTEPPAVLNDLYRRRAGEYDWLKIAQDLPVNSFYTDYNPAGGVEYEYYISARAANGTYADSAPAALTVEIQHVILSLVSDPNTWVALKKDAKKSVNRGVQRALMDFQGREYSTAEYGRNKNMSLKMEFTIWDYEELQTLIKICESKQPVLYRDRRRRKEFISLDGVDITDENPNFYTVSLGNPVKIHYLEDLT